MASASNYIQLAKALPSPLQRFFARWPPAAIVPEGAPKTPHEEQRPNPFRFVKHAVTGKWQDPVYSARRQAMLVKMAREHGVEELLPETRKGTEYRLAHRVEHGLKVKGTGVGQKVKGHIHERHMIAKYVVVAAAADGGKKKGHAGDAESYQALEEGGQTQLDQVPEISGSMRDGRLASMRVHIYTVFLCIRISMNVFSKFFAIDTTHQARLPPGSPTAPPRPGALLILNRLHRRPDHHRPHRALQPARADPNKAFTGLFIFDFDREGRILSHTIESAQAGGDWEGGVGAKVVGLTDWLLGGMKNPNDTPIPMCERLRRR
ncbi:hypothetical protein G7046_g9281 [Stylonectria norvegica]|nr:hypothetical protein G7046_g9281 [Stylonectria norvegica]